MKYTILQLWTSTGSDTSLSNEIKSVLSKLKIFGCGLQDIGGGGGFGSFYAVYRLWILQKDVTKFIDAVQEIESNDGGSQYHYGSSLITISSKNKHVTMINVQGNSNELWKIEEEGSLETLYSKKKENEK